MNHDILVCACNDVEHCMIFSYDEDFFSVNIHLKKRSFWARLVYAVKYIFGRQSKYGAFQEVLFEEKQINDLKAIIRKYEKAVKNRDDN